MSVSSFFVFDGSGGNDVGGNGMPTVIRYERIGTVVQ